MKLALQLYSVRTDMEEDFFGTLKKVREMGYEGVEFAGLYGNKPQDVKKACEELGLVPISAHVGLHDFEGKIDETMDDYQRLGCSYVVVPWMFEEDRPGHEKWEAAKSLMIELAVAAKKRNMTLLYHNHHFEMEPTASGYMLEEIYASVPQMETEVDTCWVSVGGADPVLFLNTLTGRAPVVHLKDFRLFGPLPLHLAQRFGRPGSGEHRVEYRPVGFGMQDMPALLEACRRIGTQWVVVEEDEPDSGRTRLACAALSAGYLKPRL